MGLKEFLVLNNLNQKEILGQNKIGPKKFGYKKNVVPKKNVVSHKQFWSKQIVQKKFWVPGSQKDRHRGASGAKEGFSSIGRFSKK